MKKADKLKSLARLANRSRWSEQVLKGEIMVKHINTAGGYRSSKMTWENMENSLKRW